MGLGSRVFAGVGAACAAGWSAASVVTFDNSDLAFRWTINVPPFVTGPQLDPTLPAASQTGAANAHTVGWYGGSPTTSSMIVPEDLVGGGTGKTVRGTQTFTYHNVEGDWTFTAMKTFNPGDSIGPGEDWRGSASMGAYGFALGNAWFLGPSAYAGVQFDLADGTHYGWIRLVLDGGAYQPAAWAYETSVQTPITVVPGPGAAALLGATWLCGLRRRAGR